MNKSKKKIAIIGCSSFIGRSFLSNYLENFDFALIGKNHVKEYSIDEFIEFDYPSVKFDFEKLLHFDVVINCLGGGVQSNSNESSFDIFQVNLFFPIELVEYLSANNFSGKLFSFGSYFEIGFNDKKKYFTEDEICNSDSLVPNVYCDSKRLLTKYYSNRNRDIKWFHLILPNIYGNGENKNRLIPYLVDNLKKNQPLKLSSGDQIRQYLHVNDLCSLLFNLIESDVKSDIYSVPAFEKEIKIKDLVNEVFKIFSKSENNWAVVQTRDQGMSILLLDSSKLSSIISNWSPKISLKDGILEYL